MVDINYSNQISRLFSGALDKHSIFENLKDLEEYISGKREDGSVYPLNGNKYAGQIVAVKRVDDTDSSVRVYVLYKENGVFDKKEIASENGVFLKTEFVSECDNNRDDIIEKPVKLNAEGFVDKTLIPEHGLEKLDCDMNIILDEDDHVGAYKNGDVVTKGTELQTIIKNMLVSVSEAEYDKPTLSFEFPKGRVFEAGLDYQNEDIPVTFKIEQNDSKAIKKMNIEFVDMKQSVIDQYAYQNTFDGNLIYTNYNFAFHPLIDGEIRVRVTIQYDESIVKKNAFGEEDAANAFPAGEIVEEFSIFGKRKMYFAAIDKNKKLDVIDSNTIQALENSVLDPSDGDVVSFGIPQGTSQIIIAVPTSSFDESDVDGIVIKCIKSTAQANLDICGNFEVRNVVVNSGHLEPLEYRVYIYETSAPFVSEDKLVVIL